MKVKGLKDTIDWYDKHAQQYAKGIQSLAPQDMLQKFASMLPPKAKVLDAGSTAGRDSKILADLRLDVIGIDASKNLVILAKKQYPHIRFVQGNFLDLPFSRDFFHGVWAHASLVHLESVKDTNKALKEFNRVLKIGGILYLFVKSHTDTEKFKIVSDSLSRDYRFFQFYTKEEVKALLERNGFIITFLEDNYPDNADRKEIKWIVAFAKKA